MLAYLKCDSDHFLESVKKHVHLIVHFRLMYPARPHQVRVGVTRSGSELRADVEVTWLVQ
jgi:hypothetical protein